MSNNSSTFHCQPINIKCNLSVVNKYSKYCICLTWYTCKCDHGNLCLEQGMKLFSMSKSGINFSKASIWIHLPYKNSGSCSQPCGKYFTIKYKSLGSLQQKWKMLVKGTGPQIKTFYTNLPRKKKYNLHTVWLITGNNTSKY